MSTLARPDGYQTTEAFTTRPGARVMRYDTGTHLIHTMAADGIVDPSKKVLAAISLFYPDTYAPNPFVMLTCGVGGPK